MTNCYAEYHSYRDFCRVRNSLEGLISAYGRQTFTRKAANTLLKEINCTEFYSLDYLIANNFVKKVGEEEIVSYHDTTVFCTEDICPGDHIIDQKYDGQGINIEKKCSTRRHLFVVNFDYYNAQVKEYRRLAATF